MPFSPYPFTVVADSGVREGIQFGQGPSAEVKFKVAWGSRYGFINNAVGTSKGSTKATIVRNPPLQYPPSPNLYAMDCSIEPFPPDKIMTDGASWVEYPEAIVTITFRVPEWGFDSSTTDDPSGQPWTTTTMDSSADFMTVPDSTFHFNGGYVGGIPVTGNVPTQTSVGIVIPQCAITLKRHWVPYMPVGAVLSLLATPLNQAPFDLGDFVCEPETLMFVGCPTTREMDTLGNAVQTCEYKFMYRPISWNKFLHPDGRSGFRYLYDNNGNKPYQTGDFTTLP